jgi:hypothetical protein
MRRVCTNCARCSIRTRSSDPFALVSEYRYGRLAVRDMRDHYGVCAAAGMLVPLDAKDEDETPCMGADWEARCRQ